MTMTPNFFDYGETVLLLHCKIQQTTFTRIACLAQRKHLSQQSMNASKTDKEENLTSCTHSSRLPLTPSTHVPCGPQLSQVIVAVSVLVNWREVSRTFAFSFNVFLPSLILYSDAQV